MMGMTTASTMVGVLDFEGGGGFWSTKEELPAVEISPTHSTSAEPMVVIMLVIVPHVPVLRMQG